MNHTSNTPHWKFVEVLFKKRSARVMTRSLMKTPRSWIRCLKSVLTLSWDGNVLVGLEGFPGFLHWRGHDQRIARVSVHHTLHRQEHSRQWKTDHGCDHAGIGGVPRQTLPWNCTESTTVLEMIDDYLPGNESISYLLLKRNIIFPATFQRDMDSFPGLYPDFFIRQDDGSLPGSLPKRTGDF